MKIDTSMSEAHTTSKKNVENKYKYKYIQSVSYQNIKWQCHRNEKQNLRPYVKTKNSHIKQVTRLPSPRSEAQALVCLQVHGAPCWVLLQHFYNVAIIFHRQVWYRALSLHAFVKIKLRASSSSQGYLCLCAKFRFFPGLHCWANTRRIIVHSIAHSTNMMPVNQSARTSTLHKANWRDKTTNHKWQT